MAGVQRVSQIPAVCTENPCTDKNLDVPLVSSNNFDDVQTQTPASSTTGQDHEEVDRHGGSGRSYKSGADPLSSVLTWLRHTDPEHLANWLKPLYKIGAGIDKIEDIEIPDDISFIEEEEMPNWVVDGQSQEKSMNEKGASPGSENSSSRSERLNPTKSQLWLPWLNLSSVASQQMQPSVPSQPPKRHSSHSEFSVGPCRLKASTFADEDDEWLARQRLTGSVGRLVSYASGEVPEQDVCGLRATSMGRIIVTSLSPDGPAAMAGVAVGDELVSINGRRGFAGIPVHSILAGLRSPVSLVFVGFVGKVQAEVRMKHASEIPCGMPSNARIMTGASVELCEAVIFQQPSASLLLTSAHKGGATGNVEAMYELQRDEARDILQLALVDDGLLLV